MISSVFIQKPLDLSHWVIQKSVAVKELAETDTQPQEDTKEKSTTKENPKSDAFKEPAEMAKQYPEAKKEKNIANKNMTSLSMQKKIPVYPYGVLGLDLHFTESDQYIAYGKTTGNSEDGNSLIIYNFKSDTIEKTFQEKSWDFTIKFFNEGKNLAYSCNGILHILDSSFVEIDSINSGGYIADFSISANNEVLVLYDSKRNTVDSHNLKTNRNQISTYTLPDSINTGYHNMDVSGKGQLFAISGG